jgi:hypothetical protein
MQGRAWDAPGLADSVCPQLPDGAQRLRSQLPQDRERRIARARSPNRALNNELSTYT